MIYQCTHCGKTVNIKKKEMREGEIYAELWCERCRRTTNHLECGDDIVDYYALYDPFIMGSDKLS